MTKRLDAKGKGKPRVDHDWYREGPGAVHPLFDALDFAGSLIWDPSCGGGNILDVAKARGFATVGSDIVDRDPRHRFYRSNYLQSSKWPTLHDRPLSVVNNPPYNYEPGIGERFILHTLNRVPFHLAAFLMPIEFCCGIGRLERLYSRHRPAYVGFLMQRPSMPPGIAVEELGADAYRNGMADYAWLIWKDGGPYRTEALFLPPSAHAPTLSNRPSPRARSSAERIGHPVKGN